MNDQTSAEQNSGELKKSKSQIKREFHELQDLGKELVELSSTKLDNIPVSDELKEIILATKPLKQGALSRQLKFIGKKIHDEDIAAIRLAMDALRLPHQKQVEQFHQIEHWRDALLQGDTELFNELAGKYINFERQYVNQLIRNAKNEKVQNKPPKSARLLFKYMSELLSEKNRS